MPFSAAGVSKTAAVVAAAATGKPGRVNLRHAYPAVCLALLFIALLFLTGGFSRRRVGRGLYLFIVPYWMNWMIWLRG